MKRYILAAILTAVSFGFINSFAFAQTIAPNIPSTFEQYGFFHTHYDASKNDLHDFTSYTTTGFASSPSQVPLLVAAGFRNIIFNAAYLGGLQPVLSKLLENEGISLKDGENTSTYDFRTIPNYQTKVLALYKEELLSLRSSLLSNGTLGNVGTFFLADEPALHRNIFPDEKFLEKLTATFKEVFPGKRTSMSFAQDRDSANPFRGAHFNPPASLDIISMDPYFFIDTASLGCSEDATRQYLYSTHPNSSLNWAFQFNKPVYLIGDAMLRNGEPLPLCDVTNSFNIAKKDARIKGLIWFVYDPISDGSLSGAINSPVLVNHIRNLTLPVKTASGAASSAAPSRGQCVALSYFLEYGDSDFDSADQTNGEIAQLQHFLNSQALFATSSYGTFDNHTLDAVRAFQKQNGVPTTGTVGPLTRAAIARVSGCEASASTTQERTQALTQTIVQTATYEKPIETTSATEAKAVLSCTTLTKDLQYGSDDGAVGQATNSEVLLLQRFLTAKGFLVTNVTGYFGNGTRNAVIAFQRQQGISPVSGMVGPLTRAAIASASGCAAPNTSGNANSPIQATALQFKAIPTVSLLASGVAVADGGTITATNGSIALAWGSAGAVSCTLNGVSIPISGSKTLTGVASSSHVFTCTNGYGTKALKFNVNVPTSISQTPTGTLGTYQLYINSVSYPIRASVSRATVLADCEGQKKNNQTSSIRCVWNGEEIMNYNPVSTTATLGTYQLYINNVLYPTGISVPRATALADCSGQKTNNPTASIRCTWNGEEVMSYNSLPAGSAPTISLKANGSSVASGGTVTATNGSLNLEWGSTSATPVSCVLNGVSVPSSGSQTLSGITTSSHTYTCSNSYGSASLQFNVSVPAAAASTTVPAISVSVNGSPLANGGSFQAVGGSAYISWSGTGATSCTLNGNSLSSVSGAQTFNNLPNGTGVISCTNSKGTNTFTFTVIVPSAGTAPTVRVTANGSPVTEGSTINGSVGFVDLQWNSTDATSCTLNGVAIPSYGTKLYTTAQLSSATFTYTCTNSAGSASLHFNVSVVLIPVSSLSLSASSVDVNSPFTATWSGTNSPTGYTLKVDGLVPISDTTSTSWSGTPASLGLGVGQHTISARACNSGGCGNWAQQTLSVTTPPKAPTAYISFVSSSVVSTNQELTITWSGSDSPTYYNLKVDGGNPLNVGTRTYWSVTPATLGLGAGQYSIYAQGCNAVGCGAWSSPVTLTVTVPVSLGSNSTTSVLGASTACVDLPYNMHRGYESYAVTKLQEFLKSRDFLGETTGFYGDKTVAAVGEYQKSRGLPQTGMVYDFTRAAIKEDSCQ